jgi:hypothetical protein
MNYASVRRRGDVTYATEKLFGRAPIIGVKSAKKVCVLIPAMMYIEVKANNNHSFFCCCTTPYQGGVMYVLSQLISDSFMRELSMTCIQVIGALRDIPK